MTTTTTCRRPTCERTPISGASGYCYKHAYAEGALTPFVDAARTRHIFQQAQQDGHSIATISRATGVSHGTVSRVLNGESKRVRQITEDRARRFVGHTNLTPCWPLTRRVRSLLAAGHSMTQIARGCGVARETISHIVHAEHKNVRWRVGEAVRAYWEQHCADPVSDPHPLAVKHGWQVPMMWDDIDNPDEAQLPQVDTGRRRAPTVREMQTIRDLVKQRGHHAAARQAGVHVSTIKNILSGRTVRPRVDILDRLVAA